MTTDGAGVWPRVSNTDVEQDNEMYYPKVRKPLHPENKTSTLANPRQPCLCIDDGVLFLSRRSSPVESLRSRQSEKGNRTLLKAAL